jgi:hypothetical protein
MDNDVFSILGPVVALVAVGCVLAFIALVFWVWFRIVSRTGHNGWLALLMLIPLANLVLLLILAFGEWPIYRELESLRRQAAEPGAGRASY